MKIEDLLEDKTHGSTYLAKRYLQMIIDLKAEYGQVETYNQRLLEKFGDMAIFENIIRELSNSENYLNTTKDLIEQLEHTSEQLLQHLVNQIEAKSRIMTFSHSQTVEDVLMKLNKAQIYCIESIPGGEGKKLAKNLDAILVEDEVVTTKLHTIDILLLGCDKYDTGSFINKIGTHKFCKLAHRYNTPVFVLTSKLKRVEKIKPVQDENFEQVPRSLVTILAA